MTAEFWDKRAQKYDMDIQKHDSVYVKTIQRTKSLLTNSNVILDFGCGSGEMSLDIAPHVQKLHGIDVSANMIELATLKSRDRKVGNVSFDQTDLFDKGLEEYGYSAIIAFNILHLVDDARGVLHRLNSLLTMEALLISQTPCLGERSFVFRSFISFAQKVKIAPPILSLTINDLESLISSCSFEIIESKGWDSKNAVQWIVAKKR